MFSDTVSGELPEHKRFIYETAIPYFEKRGIPTRVLRGQKTYLDCFYHIVSRGNAEGKLASFPLTGRCSIQRDCKLPPIRTYQKTLPQDTVYYLGIAADEPIRLARLKENQTSLLAKYNLTEKDAWAMCQAEGLLSPLYAFTGRGGCWFCPNASIVSRRRWKTALQSADRSARRCRSFPHGWQRAPAKQGKPARRPCRNTGNAYDAAEINIPRRVGCTMRWRRSPWRRSAIRNCTVWR